MFYTGFLNTEWQIYTYMGYEVLKLYANIWLHALKFMKEVESKTMNKKHATLAHKYAKSFVKMEVKSLKGD